MIIVEAGILLGGVYLLTRRLWLAIGLHLAWNAVQAGVWSSSVSGTGDSRGLFEATFSGPDLVTGGSMGIEGSVVTVLVCVIAGVYACYLAYRRGNIIPRRGRS